MTRRIWRVVLTLLALAGFPVLALAQTNPPTGYVIQYYNAGAPSPLTQSDTLPTSALTCGVTPKVAATAANTINPNTVLWDDPAAPSTADCRLVLGGSAALFSLPLGATYEAVVVVTSAGGNSAPSNRAPFLQAPVPAARTGLRLIR